jgi:hypothetical protein
VIGSAGVSSPIGRSVRAPAPYSAAEPMTTTRASPAWPAHGLEHVRGRRHVRAEDLARRPREAAGEVEHHVRSRVPDQLRHRALVLEIGHGAAAARRVRPRVDADRLDVRLGGQPREQVRADEAARAGDEHARGHVAAPGRKRSGSRTKSSLARW